MIMGEMTDLPLCPLQTENQTECVKRLFSDLGLCLRDRTGGQHGPEVWWGHPRRATPLQGRLLWAGAVGARDGGALAPQGVWQQESSASSKEAASPGGHALDVRSPAPQD